MTTPLSTLRNYLSDSTQEADQITALLNANAIAAAAASAANTAALALKTNISSFTVTAADLVAAGTGVAALFGTAIPINAIIMKTFVQVTTTFAGDGDDSSTISLGLNTGIDVVAAVAIKTGTPWDAGIQAGIQTGSAANMTKLTAARQLSATWTAVATDTTLAAGAMTVFCEWVQGS